MNGVAAPAGTLPWLDEPLRRTLATRDAHALLVHGPGDVGQFELALLLAQAWLCEELALPIEQRPCRACASCRLVLARSHPDQMVLVPAALRESLGWDAPGDGDDAADGGSSKKKPSKEIRVEAVRAAIEFATVTSARGRGKVVVVHPAERMNVVAANAFLKTLEEPPGNSRFVLCSAGPDTLLPTIRSRCQSVPLAVPPQALAESWLVEQGIEQPAILLAGCAGQPAQVLEWRALGIDSQAWRELPARVARRDAGACQGWPLPVVVEVLQKLCHDAVSIACGGSPRFFPVGSVAAGSSLPPLFGWSAELARVARHAEHPWTLDLSTQSLVQQGAEALQTARSAARREVGPR